MYKLIPLLFIIINSCTSDTNDKKKQIENLFNKYKHKFPNAKNIEVTQILKIKKSSEPLFIDVRDSKEQSISMIPGAITFETFKKLKKHNPKQSHIFYCTIGVRSGIEAEKYQKRGYKAFNFKGSILSWAHAGMSFENNGKPTKRVHVYGEEWNFLPDGYQAVFN